MDIIEKSIDFLKENKEKYEEAAELQLQLWNGEKPKRQPLLLQCTLDSQEDSLYPAFNTKEIHYDSHKMFLNELKAMMRSAYGNMEAVPSVRANMGTGIFPSLFPGLQQNLYEDKMPWVQEHLSKEALANMTVNDIKVSDEFKAGLEHMAYMANKLSGTGCLVYPMDLQGPFDTAHLVYGDAIFYDIYDDPDFVRHLLDLSCQAIFIGMEECFKMIPGSDRMVAHYNGLVVPREKGGIKTSEDTSTLLSKDHIHEFIAPYLRKLLSHFGGGWVHYCGKNPHLFEAVMDEPMAYGINFGNPDMHDMEHVLHRCVQADKIYYGGIPKVNENEALENYFTRLLKASKKGDRSLLLLMHNCSIDKRETVESAWKKANAQVNQG